MSRRSEALHPAAGRRAPGLNELPFFPTAFICAFLLSELAAYWNPVSGVVRPVVAVLGTVLMLQTGASLIVGRHVGAYLALVAVMAALDLKIVGFLYVALTGVLVAASVSAHRVVAVDWVRVTRLLNVVGVIVVATSALQTGTQRASVEATNALSPQGLAPAGLPDIYLVLLDAYPRADTLASELEFENTAFLSSMSDAGFEVADGAHTSYNRTLLTVTSLLDGRHLSELAEGPPTGLDGQLQWLDTVVGHAVAVQSARATGYDVVVIPSDAETGMPVPADVLIDTGQLTYFEMHLARNGLLGNVLVAEQQALYREQHRQRIFSAFEELERLASTAAERPRLIFAHIMAPHNPIVFRADGTEATIPECYWDDCVLTEPLSAEMASGFREQLAFVNDRVEATVRTIIERSDKPPVIVLFSDHGFRHWLSDRPETFRSLLLSYTPGREGVFPDDATPVNLIARLLNAYANAGLPLARDDVWYTLPPNGESLGLFPLIRWDREPPP